MGVLPITQFLDLFHLEGIGLRKFIGLLSTLDLAKVIRDGPVISGGMLKDLSRQSEVGPERNLALSLSIQQGQGHSHSGPPGRSHPDNSSQRNGASSALRCRCFQSPPQGAILFGNRRLKGIEVDSHKVNGKDPMFVHLLHMLGSRPHPRRPPWTFG